MAGDRQVAVESKCDKKCRKCGIISLSGLKCISCRRIMHHACVNNVKNMEIISVDQINCCKGENKDDLDSHSNLQMTILTIKMG